MWTLFCNPHRDHAAANDSDDEGPIVNKGIFAQLDNKRDETMLLPEHNDEDGAIWKVSKEGYLSSSGVGHRRNDTMTTCPTSDIDDDDDGFDDDHSTLQYSSDGCSSDPLEFEILRAHVEAKFQNRHLNYFGDMSCVSSCSSCDEDDKEWGDDEDERLQHQRHEEEEEQQQRPVFVWRRTESFFAEASSDEPTESLPLPTIEIERFADNASVVSRFSASVVDDLTYVGHGSICGEDESHYQHAVNP